MGEAKQKRLRLLSGGLIAATEARAAKPAAPSTPVMVQRGEYPLPSGAWLGVLIPATLSREDADVAATQLAVLSYHLVKQIEAGESVVNTQPPRTVPA